MPESYLRKLEADLKHANERSVNAERHAVNSSGNGTPAGAERLLENSSAEQFIRKLRELYSLQPSFNSDSVAAPDNASSNGSAGVEEYYPQHAYAPLQFDEIRKTNTKALKGNAEHEVRPNLVQIPNAPSSFHRTHTPSIC